MKQKINFNKGNHSTSILNRLETMRREKKYCDFKIKVGAEVIETHRNILAAGSDYFDAMLSHDTKENKSGIVEMMDVDAECVKICLDYIYKSEVDIPDEKYEQLLYVGHLMQLQELCDGVADLIGTRLHSKSFFKTKKIADMFGCKKLEEKCERFAEENFLSISKKAEFGDSEKSFIMKMLKSKKVNMKEEKKLDALLRWIKCNEERKKVLSEMVQCLELSDIPIRYRRYLLENEVLLSDCMDCFRLLSFSVMDSFAAKSPPPKNLAESKSCHIDKTQTAIVVFDKISGHLQRFNPRNGFWKQMQEMVKTELFCKFSAVALESHIYVLSQNTVFRMNISNISATWERMANMRVAHGNRPPVTEFGGCIYVIGGNRSSCVEKYDSVRNQWIKLTDRPQIISNSAVTKLGGDIYCVGGRFCAKSVNMVERLNVARSEWTQLAPMNETRVGASCVTMDDKIYALGGRNERWNFFTYRSTVERYDVELNFWTMLKPMKLERYLLKSFAVDDVIYAVGGYDDFGYSLGVERYDVKKNEWDVIPIPREMRLEIEESVKVVI